ACAMIEGRRHPGTVVLPLYARLPGPAQAAVFARRRERKIIVATNIAETSLTIPGIRYVIDTGLARIAYYNPRTRITSLAVRKISQSSARQREGRCGRVANGTCLRLYSEKDFQARHVFTPPEILRSNLADAILRMMSLGLGHIRKFPFVDAPMEKSITDGYDILVELGAIHLTGGGKKSPGGRYQLTRRGRLMARIPVDPRLSRILIEAAARDCLSEAIVMVAALSVQDPRVLPAAKSEDSGEAGPGWTHPDSDFMILLNIWEAARNKKSGELKRFCRRYGLSFTRLREWRDVHGQIRDLARSHGIHNRSAEGIDRGAAPDKFYAAFHQALLSGYLSHIAEKKQANLYQAAGSKEVMMFPGSTLFNREKQWIVSAEYVETTRRYARTAAAIERRWIPEVAGDLCRQVYFNPRWSKSRGEVVADRQAILFGLIVEEEAAVPYGQVAPEEAADIFIRRALIAGDLKHPPDFMRHNLELMDEVAGIEDRLRRREFLVTEDVLFQFYKERLESGVVDLKSLAACIGRRGGDDFLRLEQAEVMRKNPAEEELSQFPESITVAGHTLSCRYVFDPADEKDGVTVAIPAPLAGDIPADRLDWLIPGLLAEKITALIKGLPKEYRKKLVPLNRTVDIITREMPRNRRALPAELSDFIHRRLGVMIPASVWQPRALPDYLRTRLALIGEDGRELSASREAAVLQQHHPAEAVSDALAAVRRQWERDDIDWRQFPDLPEQIPVEGPDEELIAFPALVEAGSRVNLRLFTSRSRARTAHQQGVRCLLERRLSREIKLMRRDLELSRAAAAAAVYFGGQPALEAAMADRIKADRLAGDIRQAADFERHARTVVGKLYEGAAQLRERVEKTVLSYHRVRQELARMEESAQAGGPVSQALGRIRRELAGLLPERFVLMYDDYRLEQMPRYLEAARLRARRAAEDYPRHRRKEEQVDWAVTTLDRLVGELGPETSPARRAAVEDFFWMVEEYKISVFAQEVPTAGPVSAKRLRRQALEIDKMI
ncbi:MAG: ATP-dependent RNA helicase HrpA, partial [Desulfosudaceae bacterium]